jgi:hypothetical protein
MKTAILLIGNIRTWDQCKENFRSVFSNLDYDIFLSTYDLRYGYHPAVQNSIHDSSDCFLSNDEILDLFKDFNLKNYVIESISDVRAHYDNVLHNQLHPNFKNHPHSVLQYRKLLQAYELLEKYEKDNQIKYDYVIKTRCDLILNKFEIDDSESIAIISNGNVFPNDLIFGMHRNKFTNFCNFISNEFYKPICSDSHHEPPHRLLFNGLKHSELTISEKKIVNHVLRKNNIKV